MAPAESPQNVIADIDGSDGQTTYYLCQEGEELYEEKYNGGFGVPLDVGVAKEGTNAVYLLSGAEKRAVYCIGEDDVIADFEFSPDDGVWSEGNLSTLSIAPASNTGFIAVTRNGHDREVFFQASSGRLQSVYTADGQTWELSDSVPDTNPATGASLCSLKVGEKHYVFYAHQDFCIHALVSHDATWTDELVPGSVQEAAISGIYAKLHGSGFMLQFCDPEDRVYLLSEGESTKIGQIINGKVKIDNDAQGDRFPEAIKSTSRPKGSN